MASINELLLELESLPKGYISTKHIHDKDYFYLQYKENGKLMPADAGIYSDKYDDFYKYLSAL